MNVFVTGATGFVGREILQQLHAAGHAVRILSRTPNAPRVKELARRHGAEVRPGDVLDSASLEGGLSGVDAVVHLVGIISEAGRSTFEQVHTRGTEHVVQAACRSGVKRFIQMSALGTRPNAVARYHRSKWAAEEAVRRSGLVQTIFRPSIIYGPDDGFVNLFERLSRFLPALPLMGGGQSKFQPVPVGDVAACFVGALQEPRSIGQTYDVCGPEILTLEQIVTSVLEVTGRTRWKMRVPWWLARCQAACLEWVWPRLFRRPPPLNRDQLVMLQEDNVGDPRPASEMFGLKPVSFRDGIAKYLKS